MDIVIELYKSAVPEFLAEAFGMDVEEVKKMKPEDVKKALNNLKIDYKAIDEKEDKISYHTSIGGVSKAYEITGREKKENDNDVLHIHLAEKGDILGMESTDAIKKAKVKAKKEYLSQKEDFLKIIEDIDHVAHEMGHAIDSRILASNPSLVDSMIIKFIETSEMRLKYSDTGESLAVSMERIILDELEKQLENNGLSVLGIQDDRDINIADCIDSIEKVWRIKRSENERIGGKKLGQTSRGEDVSSLDVCLIPYTICKKKGIGELIEYIKKVNLCKIHSAVPDKLCEIHSSVPDIFDATQLFDIIKSGEFDDFLIQNPENYEAILPEEIVQQALEAELDEKLQGNLELIAKIKEIYTAKFYGKSVRKDAKSDTISSRRVKSNTINQAGVSEIAENPEQNKFLQNSYSNIPESDLSKSYTLLAQTKLEREKRSKAVEMEEEGITKDE